MRIDWTTLALETVNAAILIWLLARFLFRPVRALLTNRAAQVAETLAAADAARAAAAQDREEAAAALAGIGTVRAARLAEIEREATTQREAALAAAQREAAALITAAEAEALARQKQAAAAHESAAKALALDIAARLLARLPEPAPVRGFIEGLVAAVAALPPADRRALAGENEVQIHLAAPWSADDEALCRAQLAAMLPTVPAFAVTVRPDLLAGLELHSAHAIIRNSLRGDLDQIAAALSAVAP